MKPILKFLHSPDIQDLENHIEEEGNSYCFLVQMFVGPAENTGEESFDITVCSPRWLNDNVTANDIIIGRHYLIMKSFSYKKLVKFITNYIDNITDVEWDDIGNKLGRLGKWEFEDFNPDTI